MPSQSTTEATNGVGMPGAAKVTIVNARTAPSVATGTRLELGREAAGTRVAAVEVPGAAVGAFLGDQVRLAVVEHQIVDQWDLRGHTYLRCLSLTLTSGVG